MKVRILFFSTLLLITSSCGFKVNSSGSHTGNIISGIISPFIGSIVENKSSSFLISSATASPCADPVYAKLFEIKNNGLIDETNPLATQLIGADARYSFDVKSLGLSTSSLNVQFMVKAEGCNGDIYKRPITNFNSKQNIDAKSTVIAEVVNANSLVAKKLNQASRANIELLINSVSGSSTSAALNSLTSETSNSTMFTQIFGASPSVIHDSSPEVKLIMPSSLINELAVNTFSIQAFHVDPSYSFAYSWKIDGVVKSTNASWSYIPDANESGSHTINLYVGKNDGSGNIDLSKPYYTKSAAIIVNNNIMPTPPDIAINASTPNPRNTNSVSIDISTGISLANCTTFSHLAMTDTPNTPGIMQFNIDCHTNGTQTENVVFSAGDGTKTIYLWALDDEGNISNPKTVSLLLDSTAPIISNFTLANGATSSALPSVSVQVNANDSGSGLYQMRLSEISTYSNDHWQIFSTSGTFDLTNAPGDKTVYIWLKDNIGNVSSAVSYNINLVISAPTSLVGIGGSSSIALSWTGSIGASSYNIYRSLSSGSYGAPLASGVAVVNYTDSTAVAGTTYYYVVKAVGTSGSSSNSSEVSAQSIANFTISSVAVNAASSLLVSWSSVTGANNYTVKYTTSSGNASSGTAACTNTTSTSCTVSSLTAGTNYYFTVLATNNVGSGAIAYATSETAGMPIGNFNLGALSITGNTQESIAFGSAAGATSYIVKYGLSSGSYETTVSTTATNPQTISGLSSGQTIYVMVTAVNANGSLNGTIEKSITHTSAPTSLSVNGTTGSMSLTWNVVTGATAYNVYRSTISGDYTLVTPFQVASNGYLDTTVVNGGTYYYVVKAVAGTNESVASTESSARAIAAPTSLAATANSSSVGLTWNAVTGAASYNIYRSTTSGSYGSALATGVTPATYTDSSASVGVVYYYTVKAAATNSLSNASNEISSIVKPTVQFALASQTVNENAGTLNIQVSLSSATAQNVTIPISYSGTAASPARYSGPTSVSILSGATTANLVLTLVDDSTEQLDQTIIATLGTPTNATIGSTTVNTTTLQDNDYPILTVSDITTTEGAPATFSVSLNRTSIRNITFDYYTQDNSALSGTNYLAFTGSDSISAGQTSKTYYVITYPDVATPTSSSSKTFSFRLQNVINVASNSIESGTGTIDKPSFYLPLTSSLIATRPATGATPTYSRSDSANYIATVIDFEGLLKPAKNGEARFAGARRVENYVSATENLSTNWSGNRTSATYYSSGGPLSNGYTTVAFTGQQYILLGTSFFIAKVLPSRTYQMSGYIRNVSGGTTLRISQEGTACTGGSGCSYWPVTVTSSWQRFTTKFTTGTTVGGTFQPLFYQFSGDYAGVSTFDISSVQVEDVTGQSNQNPSEYISCGVLSSPYNGAGVDCVKYFETYNGNTFNSTTHLMTEAPGASIPQSQNLLSQSSAFMTSPWASYNPATFTANAGIAPDGTNTAFNANNTYTNSGGRKQTITLSNPQVGARYIFSIWAKKAASNPSATAFLQMNLSGGANALKSTGATPSISDQWQRISLSIDIDYTDRTSLLVTMGNATSIANTNILYWGAQLEQASNPGKYIATTTSSSSQFLQGYLSEGTRTNLILNSANLGSFSYINPTTVSVMAPDGSTNSTQFTFDTAAGGRTFIDSGFVGNTTYAGSVYAKAVSGSTISTVQLNIKDQVTDAIKGSSSSVSINTTTWTKITVAGTTAGSNPGARFEINGNASGSSAKVLLWGAQLEQASFASSYIPTVGSTTIRGADSLSYPTSTFINTQGTFSVKYAQYGVDSSNRNYLLNISDGGFNRFSVRSGDGSTLVPQFVVGNGSANTTIGSASGTQIYSSMNLFYGRYSNSISKMTMNGTTTLGSNGYLDGGISSFNLGSGVNPAILIKELKSSNRVFDDIEIQNSGF